MIDFYLGMSKPPGSTTERYRLEDFSEDQIDQRLINVVRFSIPSEERFLSAKNLILV